MLTIHHFVRSAAAILCFAAAPASLVAQVIGYSVRSGFDDQLYTIDLTNGIVTPIGPVGFGDVEGVAFQPGTGDLFGWDDTTNALIRIDPVTGAGTLVGPSGITTNDVGLTFDRAGNLWLSDHDGGFADEGGGFWSVDVNTGAASLVGSTSREITALADRGSRIFGLDEESNELVSINTTTAEATAIGPLGIDISDAGMALDRSGILWAINDDGTILTIDRSTGAATVVHTASDGFESLDILIPEPTSSALAALGSMILATARMLTRRR